MTAASYVHIISVLKCMLIIYSYGTINHPIRVRASYISIRVWDVPYAYRINTRMVRNSYRCMHVVSFPDRYFPFYLWCLPQGEKAVWKRDYIIIIFLLYKAEKPSVRLSDRHATISAVSVSIETRLARNES